MPSLEKVILNMLPRLDITNGPLSLENVSNAEKISSKEDRKCNLRDILRKQFKKLKLFMSKDNKTVCPTHNFKGFKASGEIVQLATPIKSENDKKEYKVIKLPNGLTALLISDSNQIVEQLNPVDCTLENERKMFAEIAKPAEERTDNECVPSSCNEDDTEKGAVRTCHMKEEKLAAVSLSVGVGSVSDPEEIPGLAHFLEHMVFMGTKKFPEENSFCEYIVKHGGRFNGHTDSETTWFWFECPANRLPRAMDLFAQFFISPLMKREAMTREREAVGSEFQRNATDDSTRECQLLKSMAIEKHPASKFNWGNLKTLRDNVTDDQLYDAVHNFRNRHYSAHRMTLTVQASLPLDLLEKWVAEYFCAIPNNSLPPEDYTLFKGQAAFDNQKYCQFYTVNPVEDVCHLDITWLLPPVVHLYRKKPLEYISWLLSHNGRGSLLSHLRRKVWSLEISTDALDADTEYNSLYRLYTMRIFLTKGGLRNLPRVIQAVFAYLKLLHSKGPQEDLFKEIQSIQEARFRFVEETHAFENVQKLSNNMHKYPPEDYICGDELYFEYDPEEISRCLSEFRLDNVNFMLLTKTPREGVTFDQTEQWFGTQYHAEPIPQDWIDKWSNVEPYPDLALPEKNPFIATDLSILPEEADTRDQPYPEKLVASESHELWYHRDYKYLVPKSSFYVQIGSPVQIELDCDWVVMEILQRLLNLQLLEELYPAIMADLTYDLEITKHGMSIRCYGYNQKIRFILETILRGFKSFNDNLDKRVFAAVKDEMQKDYYNYLMNPENVSEDAAASLIGNHLSILEQINTFKPVTPHMLKAFVNSFFKRITKVKFLVQGSISKEEAVTISQGVMDFIGSEVFLAETPSKVFLAERVKVDPPEVDVVPVGERVCRVRSLNKHNITCVTSNYYYSGSNSIEDICAIKMLVMLMKEPLFNKLRTQEQLGYVVECAEASFKGYRGFSISVAFRSDKYTNEYIDERIEEFLKTFINDLKRMKPEKFNTILESLIKLHLREDLKLKNVADKNWEIILRYGKANFQKWYIKYFKVLKPSTVIKWLNDHTLCGNRSNVRKSSIQVVPAKETRTGVADDGLGESQDAIENLSYEYLPLKDSLPAVPTHNAADWAKVVFLTFNPLRFIFKLLDSIKVFCLLIMTRPLPLK